MALEDALALLIFVGRTGDVLSTLYATPTMIMEANPLARRFKWPTFILGYAFCVVPFFDVLLGVMVAVPFLLVTASNLSRAWMMRTLGEAEMDALVLRTAGRSSLRMALGLVWLAGLFLLLPAALLMEVTDDPFAVYFALGLGLYAAIFAIHSTFFFVRTFRRVRSA